MARKRKSNDAAGGFLLLIGVTCVLVIFIVRVLITAVFYLLVPLLVISWALTLQFREPDIQGTPEQYDDGSKWRKIKTLSSNRRLLFKDLQSQYIKGTASGLTLTAKSDDRLFHAGSKLGKQINHRIEQIYTEMNALESEIRELRLSVLHNLPDWESSVNSFLLIKKVHVASGVSLITLFVASMFLSLNGVLPDNISTSAAGVLLWNPKPEIVSGYLVIACGLSVVTFCGIWLFADSRVWKSVDQKMLAEWQSLEDKWSEELELEALYISSEDFYQENHQNRRASNIGEEQAHQSWHQILNVSPDSSIEEIKQAYKQAIKQYHPDRVSGLGVRLKNLAEEESKKINVAFAEAKRIRGFA